LQIDGWQCYHAQVGTACLADLTLAEEACCSASVQVAVGSDGSLHGMTKAGRAALDPDMLLVRSPQQAAVMIAIRCLIPRHHRADVRSGLCRT
jgi:exosome complex RNA-binding protein Rrp42 (RNase PH superfamily)